MDILDLATDDAGQPIIRVVPVTFYSGDHGFDAHSVRRSKHSACAAYSFVEFPPGFESAERIADRDQIAVVLSGRLRMTGNDGASVELGPGQVFQLKEMETAAHVLKVVSEDKVCLMVVQS